MLPSIHDNITKEKIKIQTQTSHHHLPLHKNFPLISCLHVKLLTILLTMYDFLNLLVIIFINFFFQFQVFLKTRIEIISINTPKSFKKTNLSKAQLLKKKKNKESTSKTKQLTNIIESNELHVNFNTINYLFFGFTLLFFFFPTSYKTNLNLLYKKASLITNCKLITTSLHYFLF